METLTVLPECSRHATCRDASPRCATVLHGDLRPPGLWAPPPPPQSFARFTFSQPTAICSWLCHRHILLVRVAPGPPFRGMRHQACRLPRRSAGPFCCRQAPRPSGPSCSSAARSRKLPDSVLLQRASRAQARLWACFLSLNNARVGGERPIKGCPLCLRRQRLRLSSPTACHCPRQVPCTRCSERQQLAKCAMVLLSLQVPLLEASWARCSGHGFSWCGKRQHEHFCARRPLASTRDSCGILGAALTVCVFPLLPPIAL